MGQLSERFAHITYRNEADVAHHFLLPLLTELLGYRAEEILPERSIPALQIPTSRRSRGSSEGLRARPDFLLSLDGGATFAGACDAKAPTEDLDRHLDQVRAYANALHTTNLILLTNGFRTTLLHGNTVLINASSIEELDLAFEQLWHVFGREQAAKLTERERLISLGAVPPIDASTLLTAQKRNRVDVSDFTSYLRELTADQDRFNIPAALRDALGSDTAHVEPLELHRFQQADVRSKGDTLDLSALLAWNAMDPLLVVGESGIGKSVLLRDICRRQADWCLDATSNQLPVLLSLRAYSAVSSIETMAQQRLTPNAATPGTPDLRRLMHEGRLMLVLDAFDEVLEESRPQFERDLANLLEAFPRTRVIMSTRPQFRPNVGRLLAFRMDQLDQERTNRFLARQMGIDPQAVIGHLRSTQLERLASNTLLLSLICVQLKRGQSVPRTRTALLQATIHLVEESERAKPNRSRTQLPWPTRTRLLSELAALAISNGAAYTLARPDGDAVLRRALSDLEELRDGRPGMSVRELATDLASTGFLVVEDSGYAFWHRSFAEHFAAAELAKSIDSGTCSLGALAGKSNWRNVVPDAVCRSKRVDEHLNTLASVSILLAGEALANLDIAAVDASERITRGLFAAVRSEYPLLRRRARDTLSLISTGTMEGNLETTIADDTAPLASRFWGLVELARRNPERARPIVEAHLGCDAFDDLECRGAHEAVAEALGEIGSEWAQQTLLDRWKGRHEAWFGSPIARQFVHLVHRGMLLPSVGAALVSWFCSDDIEYWTLENLGTVLIAMNTDDVACDVASRIRRGWPAKDKSHSFAHARVLESLTIPRATDEIIAGLADSSLPLDVHRRFGEALGHSNAPTSADVLVKLAASGDLYVRSQALRRLSRFGWDTAEASVKRALAECRAPEAAASELEYLQARAVDALVEHDRLDLLASPHYAPQGWFRLTLFCLLDALVARPRRSITELVTRFRDVDDPRLRARVAVILAASGRLADACVIRDELLAHATGKDYVESDLLDVSGSMVPHEALEWVREVWEQSNLARESLGGFMFSKYCEVLERIGTREASEVLLILAARGSESEATDALSHLYRVATTHIQDSIVALAGARKSPAIQRWCTHILGAVGDLRVAHILEARLKDDDPLVRASAFEGLVRIHERGGTLWFGGEEVAAPGSGSSM